MLHILRERSIIMYRPKYGYQFLVQARFFATIQTSNGAIKAIKVYWVFLGCNSARLWL
jgi:hypothetical protein